ncbi:hypothetical protein BAU15_06585 [Enterococcus sp. JM4C]|uniref:ClbS/DfsB family four-helix bundle protein n=1 Tax=Candidatus Enterococcus huntleyi TaxID=1857217 RepID=UPI0013799B85|nr:ClbS/DfsB family four-helix bundle protein [Enterococcus sp. JM4C]KAF1297210.1 hypothetical protein BAU15_06585 [Enterococcus sp. JM4C]
MARPRTKSDLLQASEENFATLLILIDSLPEEALDTQLPFADEKDPAAHWKRDKTLKDVLIHLYEWHQLLLNWVTANQKGVTQQFLKEGYNWRSYGSMNVEFVEKHQETSFNEALALVKDSHTKVMVLANEFSDEQLFLKKQYKWVGGSTLGGYFVSSTASHYDWAIKKVKRYKKTL